MVATVTEMPPITIDGDRLSVRFDRFDASAYERFLQVKRLPEFELKFDVHTESYTVTAPKRFATMLGAQLDQYQDGELAMADFLYDDQAAIVRMALDSKRFACWSDCGLGKTPITLEFARQVIHRTKGRFLILTMNEIVPQFIEECRKFYRDTLPILRLNSRAELKQWCAEGDGIHQLAITNYEKMNPDADGQTVNEMRYLAGVALDESSRLKTGGGKQKWAIIKSCKGIEYKLSCTATPAPNDTMEFASQASFLERMRNESEIIWTYFHRNPKTHRWSVKRHARKAFFEFMAGWSIYVRDPRRYGWRKGHKDVPAPIVKMHELAMSPGQATALQKLSRADNGQISLFQKSDVNTIQRAKMSQIAKGFRYRKVKGKSGKDGRTIERIESAKPGFVADLAAAESRDGLQVLLWTVFDAESTILAEELRARGIPFDLLTGATPDQERIEMLERFRHGQSPVLISRASMLGFGMNFQCCGSMIFSGWNDSYEQYYQAWRRAVRDGQTKRVRIHIPVIPELEGDMLETIFEKEGKHLAAIDEMESNYIAACKALTGGAA